MLNNTETKQIFVALASLSAVSCNSRSYICREDVFNILVTFCDGNPKITCDKNRSNLTWPDGEIAKETP